ncbi:WD40 repeat-containing protein [Heterostelium album PN500]|uniref:peptidylprolyl isomerase n=1 Tax=Heterostelium pallidum (strain ATCC 26659 / Pp 5 / PN500) TaxID=670386 RepID=D3AY94_HETP5|nr:WD40 repeat-containing protein [Heterostelium album PN500]EFA85921.1 WD40 repeat-containing protein [Heterostelium album PN500]|eukprot:XP_020438027.1 WD40 repeat-containing protein [Heterostelium album PN500]
MSFEIIGLIYFGEGDGLSRRVQTGFEIAFASWHFLLLLTTKTISDLLFINLLTAPSDINVFDASVAFEAFEMCGIITYYCIELFVNIDQKFAIMVGVVTIIFILCLDAKIVHYFINIRSPFVSNIWDLYALNYLPEAIAVTVALIFFGSNMGTVDDNFSSSKSNYHYSDTEQANIRRREEKQSLLSTYSNNSQTYSMSKRDRGIETDLNNDGDDVQSKHEHSETKGETGLKEKESSEIDTDNNNNSNSNNKDNHEKKKVKRDLPFEQVYLDNLPNTEMYERSYMHKDVCNQMHVTKTEFIITGDILGYIKFWKKQPNGIDFVKTFKSHQGLFTMTVSYDGLWMCSAGQDKNVRIFDVNNFDIVNSFKIDYLPLACQWIYSKESGKQLLAISSRESPNIFVYDIRGEVTSQVVHTLTIHKRPVHLIGFNVEKRTVVSVDLAGMIEYWSPEHEYNEPTAELKFSYKLDTDLYVLKKEKTVATSLHFSNNGQYFAMMARDRKIRVFNYASGSLHRVYDESYTVLNQIQKEEDSPYHIDPNDFGRRMAVERDIENNFDQSIHPDNLVKPTTSIPPPSNIIFDESDSFLMYPTLIGIKIINMISNKVVRVLGMIENSTRFLGISLYQGKNEGDLFMGTKKRDATPDPTLFCLAYKKQRFYMFSRREPEDTDNADLGRDVFNEKVNKDEQMLLHNTARKLPRNAVIHTSVGDVHVQLFPDECPKTVENFTTHAKNGYYDGIIFHRVIKGFMVQTGDPQGDGTGGTSIWGKDFEDEFSRNLRHDRPFTVSMANAGPGTNGSQFFITTVPVTRLDNKHTVFGRVYKGMEAVSTIENARTDKSDRPLEDITIVGIKITSDVPEEFKQKKK